MGSKKLRYKWDAQKGYTYNTPNRTSHPLFNAIQQGGSVESAVDAWIQQDNNNLDIQYVLDGIKGHLRQMNSSIEYLRSYEVDPYILQEYSTLIKKLEYLGDRVIGELNNNR